MDYETPTFSPDTESAGTIETELVQPEFYPEAGATDAVDSAELVEPDVYPEEESGGETVEAGLEGLTIPQAFDSDLHPVEAQYPISPDEDIVPQA